jgi:hypothetical protein
MFSEIGGSSSNVQRLASDPVTAGSAKQNSWNGTGFLSGIGRFFTCRFRTQGEETANKGYLSSIVTTIKSFFANLFGRTTEEATDGLHNRSASANSVANTDRDTTPKDDINKGAVEETDSTSIDSSFSSSSSGYPSFTEEGYDSDDEVDHNESIAGSSSTNSNNDRDTLTGLENGAEIPVKDSAPVIEDITSTEEAADRPHADDDHENDDHEFHDAHENDDHEFHDAREDDSHNLTFHTETNHFSNLAASPVKEPTQIKDSAPVIENSTVENKTPVEDINSILGRETTNLTEEDKQNILSGKTVVKTTVDKSAVPTFTAYHLLDMIPPKQTAEFYVNPKNASNILPACTGCEGSEYTFSEGWGFLKFNERLTIKNKLELDEMSAQVKFSTERPGAYVKDIKGNFQVSFAEGPKSDILSFARYEISIDLKDGIVKRLLPHTLLADVSAQILDNIIEGAKGEFGL